MKSLLAYSVALLAATSLMAADKDDVTSAAQKLAGADNYSWTTTTEGGRGNATPSHSKTQKDGLIWTEIATRGNTIEAYAKGGKATVKGDDGWAAVDLTAAPQRGGGGGGGAPDPARMAGMRLRNLKAPSAEVTDLIGKTKEIAKVGDAYAGDLTEEGAKAMLTFGGRRGGGGAAPTVANAKGSVKFWLQDGVISKYQVKVSGTVTFNGNDRDIDRTTTVEINDVGATKITVPDDAKSKLS